MHEDLILHHHPFAGLSTEPLTIPSPNSLPYLLSKSVYNCADADINPAGSCSEDESIPLLPKIWIEPLTIPAGKIRQI